MNANELADELEDWYNGNQINDTDPVPQAATMLRQQQDKLTKYELRHAEQRKRIDELETMLRQQQAEIEALKKQCRDIHENGAQVIDNLDKIILRQAKQIEMLQREQNGCD